MNKEKLKEMLKALKKLEEESKKPLARAIMVMILEAVLEE